MKNSWFMKIALLLIAPFVLFFAGIILFHEPPIFPTHVLNSTLDLELKDFYPDKTESLDSLLCKPRLSHSALTYSLNSVVILTDEKYFSVEKAKRRFAEIFLDYQKKLNSIYYIRPFLAEFPLTPKSFSLTLNFFDGEGNIGAPPEIARIHSNSRDLEFSIFAPEFWGVAYKDILIEPVENVKFFQPAFKPFVERKPPPLQKIEIPLPIVDNKTPPKTRSLLSFAQTFSKKYNLFPLALDCVGENYYDKIAFGFALWGKEQIEFDQARRMAAQCAKDFLEFIRNDKASLLHMKYRSEDPFYKYPSLIPDARHITFRISLWDEGINRQPAPYIAEIRFQNSIFQYFTSDEGQNLVPVFQESFLDAMRFLEDKESIPTPTVSEKKTEENEIASTNPVDILNIRFDKDLQNFYSIEKHAYPMRMWIPELSRGGFTYSFEPLQILTGVTCSSVDEGEKWFVPIFKEYQRKLNSIPYIRPYLAEFPLTPRSIHLEVAFRNHRNEPESSPKISSVLVDHRNTVNLLFYDPAEKNAYKVFVKKTFEECAPFSSLLKPFVERITPPSQELEILRPDNEKGKLSGRDAVFPFVQTFAQKENFLPLFYNHIFVGGYDRKIFTFVACGRQKILFEKAHLLAAKCARDFFSYLKGNEEILKFMRERSKRTVVHDVSIVPELQHIAFRLSFWDEGINRQPSPFIAEIRFEDSTFTYFTSDEGQNLVPVFKETFTEAMKFLKQKEAS